MPICIECRYPISQLYHVLHSGNAGSRKPPPINRSTKPTQPDAAKNSPPARSKPRPTTAVTGPDVRLTQCPRCKRFADKYVEHDYVVLFIDLVLVKPQVSIAPARLHDWFAFCRIKSLGLIGHAQVYRHLLFNRLGREDDELDPSITRLGTLLLLFDVYLTWSRIERLPHLTASSPIPHLPILLQYAFYLLFCAITTAAQHLTIRWLAGAAGLGVRIDGVDDANKHDANESARSTPNGISTALFVSSCMKLFPILMVVWKYDDARGSVGRGVEWAVAVQNLEALRILLECGYSVKPIAWQASLVTLSPMGSEGRRNQRVHDDHGCDYSKTTKGLCEGATVSDGESTTRRALRQEMSSGLNILISMDTLRDRSSRGCEIEASVLYDCGDWRIATDVIDLPGLDELQIVVRAVGLGTTDLQYYLGGDVQVNGRMSLGHQVVGTVILVGAQVEGFQVEDAVVVEAPTSCKSCARCREGSYNTCYDPTFRDSVKPYPHFRGFFPTRINNPASRSYRLPPKMPLEMGTLFEPLAIARYATEQAELQPKTSVLILGADILGLSCAAVCMAVGAKRVIIADVRKDRMMLALDHRFVTDGTTVPMFDGDDVKEQLHYARKIAGRAVQLTNLSDGFDVVLECAGTDVYTQAAVYACRIGGKVLVLGHGDRTQTIPDRKVDISGTFGRASGYQSTIDFVARPDVKLPDLRQLITHRFEGLTNVSSALKMVPTELKVLITLAPKGGKGGRQAKKGKKVLMF
ncbi:MAG: hypothetical protein Q9207_001553 [Kuettlingeria erythrocarpa]